MKQSFFYTDMSWPKLQELAKKDAIILLPIGQTEEHGPHLSVGCDYYIAQETSRRIFTNRNS